MCVEISILLLFKLSLMSNIPKNWCLLISDHQVGNSDQTLYTIDCVLKHCNTIFGIWQWSSWHFSAFQRFELVKTWRQCRDWLCLAPSLSWLVTEVSLLNRSWSRSHENGAEYSSWCSSPFYCKAALRVPNGRQTVPDPRLSTRWRPLYEALAGSKYTTDSSSRLQLITIRLKTPLTVLPDAATVSKSTREPLEITWFRSLSSWAVKRE